MNMDKRFTQVEFGTHKVEVPAGGYYDRYRMNPDLDEVARDPAAGNIDFFRRIPKRLVASTVGPTWAPNFYYRSSHVQLLFLAPADRLRAADTARAAARLSRPRTGGVDLLLVRRLR